MPSTPFIGVRISWLIVARNVDLRLVSSLGLAARCLCGVGALAQLAEQPRILHRDYRLRSEVLEQRNLFFGKRPHFPANGDDLPEEHIVLAQRNAQQGAAARLDRGAHHRPELRRDLRQVGDLDKPVSLQQPHYRMPGRKAVALPQLRSQWLRMTAHRDGAELLPVIGLKTAMGNAAQRHGLVEHRFEHRREIAGRAS